MLVPGGRKQHCWEGFAVKTLGACDPDIWVRSVHIISVLTNLARLLTTALCMCSVRGVGGKSDIYVGPWGVWKELCIHYLLVRHPLHEISHT
jgi:hypothetical protein